ncbi:hypothetical protein [Streptomyces ossamyceticus]|uniref:hypothetical protein n=1 Tax=Streptomyces ossamyceticus TaxID=249581 RepID=UPI0034334FD3
MHLIEDLYLGWQPLTHTITCPNPVWDTVELRHDDGVRPVLQGDEPHSCANDLCGHENGFTRVQVRLLCDDCQTVYTLAGDGLGIACTTTALTGWGQPPRKTCGVWLWPGQPATAEGEPHDYLVTRDRVTQVTRANLAGLITAYRDSEGRPRWIAGADPNPDGAHQIHSLTFTHRSAGLETLEDAARWVATHREQLTPALVVAV